MLLTYCPDFNASVLWNIEDFFNSILKIRWIWFASLTFDSSFVPITDSSDVKDWPLPRFEIQGSRCYAKYLRLKLVPTSRPRGLFIQLRSSNLQRKWATSLSNYQESATSVTLIDHNDMTVSPARSSSFITVIVQFDLLLWARNSSIHLHFIDFNLCTDISLHGMQMILYRYHPFVKTGCYPKFSTHRGIRIPGPWPGH